MKKIKEPKEYEIDSFETLLNVINEKNFASFTEDLLLWLLYHVKMMAEIRRQHPRMTKGKSNSDLGKYTFIWVDDGEHELKYVKIKNGLTGEIQKFQLK